MIDFICKGKTNSHKKPNIDKEEEKMGRKWKKIVLIYRNYYK